MSKKTFRPPWWAIVLVLLLGGLLLVGVAYAGLSHWMMLFHPTEPWAVVVQRETKKLSMRDYLARKHVTVTQMEGFEPLDLVLAKHGFQRDVALRCQHYLAACEVVVATGPDGSLVRLRDVGRVELAGGHGKFHRIEAFDLERSRAFVGIDLGTSAS